VHRSVSSYLEAEVVDVADIVLSLAVADDIRRVYESLSVTVNGWPQAFTEVAAPHAGRLHVIDDLPTGRLIVRYDATVAGQAASQPVDTIDAITYLRPSRYCESDRLAAVAVAQFRGLRGRELLIGVASWVGVNVGYVYGSSRPSDGAIATLLGRQGVCRDFAHLAIAMLRACNTPARLVSAYAPGLCPMDFHAVAEAFVDGNWYVVDPTALAPRSTLVRIATGRDSADTAFLTSQKGLVNLVSIQVAASADPVAPVDNLDDLVQLR
jgi:transglutaminase-like putative cysteine protease